MLAQIDAIARSEMDCMQAVSTPAPRFYLDQQAQPKTTFPSCRVKLENRAPNGNGTLPRVELVEETLDYIKKGEARAHLPFEHSVKRNSSRAHRRDDPIAAGHRH